MYDGNPISGSVITGKRVGRKYTGTFVSPYNNATVEFTIAPDRNDKLRMETVTRLKDGKKNETSFLTRVAKEDMAKALDETNNRKLSSDAKAVIDYFRAEGAK